MAKVISTFWRLLWVFLGLYAVVHIVAYVGLPNLDFLKEKNLTAVSLSPVLKTRPGDTVEDEFDWACRGNWRELWVNRPNSPVYRKLESEDRKVEINTLTLEAISSVGVSDRFEAWSTDGQVDYWDPSFPVRCLLSTKTGQSPVSLVQAVQRKADGIGFRRGWILTEDLVSPKLPEAKWSQALPRSNPRVDGLPKVIDSFVVLLKPGQSSAILAYSAPNWEQGEEGRFCRRWKVSSIGEATFQLEINGHKRTVPRERKLDSDDICIGREFVVRVVHNMDDKLCNVSVPIEFVYYREPVKDGVKA